jgi:hypothetical protein
LAGKTRKIIFGESKGNEISLLTPRGEIPSVDPRLMPLKLSLISSARPKAKADPAPLRKDNSGRGVG